jgi:hypothetical protein
MGRGFFTIPSVVVASSWLRELVVASLSALHENRPRAVFVFFTSQTTTYKKPSPLLLPSTANILAP